MLDQPHASRRRYPPTDPADRLDAWLPAPAVRTHHRRVGRRPPDGSGGRRDEPAAVRHPHARAARPLADPGLDRGLTYGELFRAYPFTVLEEGERHLLAGLCGRIWTMARDYPRLPGPDAFARWDEPGTVRVLFGHWVEDCDDGSASSSARRACSLWTAPRPSACARCGR